MGTANHISSKKKMDFFKKKVDGITLYFRIWNGPDVCETCRLRKMLRRKPILDSIGVNTTEIWTLEVGVRRDAVAGRGLVVSLS